jgi:hypothetical protein
MTHNAERCSYAAVALNNNSILHLSDSRQRPECREKDPEEKVMDVEFGDQNHGDFHELNKRSCAVSPYPTLHTWCFRSLGHIRCDLDPHPGVF